MSKRERLIVGHIRRKKTIRWISNFVWDSKVMPSAFEMANAIRTAQTSVGRL